MNNSKTQDDENHLMDFLLQEDFSPPKPGDIRNGWVVAYRNNELLVDIGAKSEGVINASELQTLDSKTRESLSEGSEITVVVVSSEDAHGNIVVSYTKALADKAWIDLQKKQDENAVCEGEVVAKNRGGWLVSMSHLTAFLPASQVSRRISQTEGEIAIGRTVHVKILEIDPNKKRLIVSERAAESEVRQTRRKEFMATIEVGNIYDGQVINLAHFGAFVDIGGMEGLVHLSEISWKRISKPSELLQVGDKVKVQVLSIDEENERLALSMKSLTDNPWNNIDELYQEGQLVSAKITKITKFGAFARLSDDYQLEGLIHISELSENHIEHPTEVVKVGQEVTVRIIRVDVEQRQLGLSIKQVTSTKFVDSDIEMFNVGDEE